MKNIEKIAAYFENELSEAEKQDLLKELDSNPELKSEFDFQEQVIEGIKATRKAELKEMLNNVPVASVGTSSSSFLYKTLIGGAATIIVGSGIYWYYIGSNEPSESVQEPVTIEYQEKESTVEIDDIIPVVEDKELANSETIINTTKVVESAKTSPKAATPTVDMPEMPTDSFDSQTLPEESLEVPKTIRNASVNLNSKIDVEVKMKKKYNFHYQFVSGKLVLYGDFDDSLFEVLELNDEDESNLYLYYKSNYYYIKDKSGEIVELKEVKDKALIQKLASIR